MAAEPAQPTAPAEAAPAPTYGVPIAVAPAAPAPVPPPMPPPMQMSMPPMPPPMQMSMPPMPGAPHPADPWGLSGLPRVADDLRAYEPIYSELMWGYGGRWMAGGAAKAAALLAALPIITRGEPEARRAALQRRPPRPPAVVVDLGAIVCPVSCLVSGELVAALVRCAEASVRVVVVGYRPTAMLAMTLEAAGLGSVPLHDRRACDEAAAAAPPPPAEFKARVRAALGENWWIAATVGDQPSDHFPDPRDSTAAISSGNPHYAE